MSGEYDPGNCWLSSDGWSFDSEGNPQLKATISVIEDGEGIVEDDFTSGVALTIGRELTNSFRLFSKTTLLTSLYTFQYAASGSYPVNTVRFSDYAGNYQMSQVWLQENLRYLNWSILG